jgi:urea transporter
MGEFMNSVMQKNLKSHLKDYFEDLSQSLFFRDAKVGAAFLAVSVFFKPEIFLWGVLASLVGYFYSTQSRTPKVLRHTGLLPVNGFFFGIAMASLFHQNTSFYLTVLIGALALPLLTKALFEVLQHWKLTPLIMPYILVVWGLFLCSQTVSLIYDPKFLMLQPLSLPMGLESYLPFGHDLAFPAEIAYSNSLTALFNSIFVSMGRIFFFENLQYGACLLALITVFSPRRGVYFFLGTALATVVLFELVPSSRFAFQADLSYCAGLVGLGLASLPEQFSLKTILLFSVISLFSTLALAQFIYQFGLPLLSLPYVLTFWLALLSRVPKLNVVWEQARA